MPSFSGGVAEATCWLRVLIVTNDAADKARHMVDALAPHLGNDIEVVIATGAGPSGTGISLPGVSVRAFPGESIFDLRARIGELAQGAQWLALLEDHNRVPEGWLAALRREIAGLSPEHAILIGSVDNRTSTDRWSWANFLHSFYSHWSPRFDGKVGPLITNIVMRVERLPERRLARGEFEEKVLTALAAAAESSPRNPIDHVQFRTWRDASAGHWHNGRITGEHLRRHSGRGLVAALKHARKVGVRRVRSIKAAVARHPDAARLPAGTLLRVRWLALCHASGAITGALLGSGRAAHHLE